MPHRSPEDTVLGGPSKNPQDPAFRRSSHLQAQASAERVNSAATDDALLEPAGVGAGAGPGMQPLPSSTTGTHGTEVFDGEPKLFSEQPDVPDAMANPAKSHSRRSWPVSLHGLTPHHVREHPGFKRNKLTLLSMGIAVVLVANVTFLGFLTPPKSPRVPLLYFDLPANQQLDGVASNGFVNLILNKTSSRLTNGALSLEHLDYSKLSVSDYVALWTTVDQNDYCPYTLLTVFFVFNGFAFSFAVATLFLVAVVPVFIRRHHWDAYLARAGAVSMTITLVFFVVAFLLAGFVTAGVGQPDPVTCDYTTSETQLLRGVVDGSVGNGVANIFVASVYVTLGMICVLLVLVIGVSLREGTPMREPGPTELQPLD